jgi:PhnB protein
LDHPFKHITQLINMSTNPIPVSIAPWLSVSHGEKAADFYKRAFGAIETYRLEVPGGGLVVQLSVQGAAFWISSEPASGTSTLVENLGGDSVRMILTVPNPDVFFAQALEAGGIEIFAVGDGHGWRLGRLVDPFGLHWEIGHQLTAK